MTSTALEPVIDPDRPLIDAHHHLSAGPGESYVLDDLIEDLSSGHRITSTVYCENKAFFRADGPEELRAAGEVEFANGAAAIGASGRFGPTRFCAAIVGSVDLRRGAAVEPALEALIAAGNGRLRGVRTVAGNDPEVKQYVPAGLLADERLREGFARLGSYGLTWETWLYHTQLGELRDLVETRPEQPVAIDHAAGLIGIGSYADRRDLEVARWRRGLQALAEFPNVHVKLGGFYMREFALLGSDLSSSALARAAAPIVDTCLEIFGPARCMFESNFPLTRDFLSYRVLWNSFKRLSDGLSESEKDLVLHDTAAAFYHIEEEA